MHQRLRDDESLLQLYLTANDRAARDELVERYLPLVRKLARRYSHTSEPLDDLCQVGALALCKAIDRYRPGAGASFRAYAMPTIVGELRRHFRDTGWALHIPRALQERSRALGTAVTALTSELGRSPTVAELAAATGLAREDVIEGLEVRMAYETAPLEGPDGDGDGPWLAAADDRGFERVEYHAVLERTLRALPARERLLLHLRFNEDLSQSEIARRVGVSQMHVSRLLRRAIARLQAAANADAGDDPARFGVPAAG